MTNQEELQNVDYFKYLGIMKTSDTKTYTLNQIQKCHGKSSIQQEEDFLHQEIGLKFKLDTSKMLYLEHSFITSGKNFFN